MDLDSIPCLIVRDHGRELGPLTIWHHGWGGSRGLGSKIPEALRRIAAHGMVVVCPDAPEHGSRATPVAMRRQTFNGWAVITDVMERARQEAGPLLNACLRLPFVTGPVQVAGISMGGLIAQLSFTEDSRILAMASILGRSTFHQADPWCRQAQLGTWAAAWCDRFATRSRPEAFVGRPVLFVDGGLDEDCPADLNAETTRLINCKGGTARNFIDPSAGHNFTPAMQDVVVGWILGHAGL